MSITNAQLPLLLSDVYCIDSAGAKTDVTGKKKNSVDGSTTDLKKFNYHASTLLPGKTNHPLRALTDMEEIIIVKEGELTITINDSLYTAGPGSIALIEPGDRQSFKNTSNSPVSYFVLGFTGGLPIDSVRGKKAGGSFVKKWNELAVTPTGKGESRPVMDRPTAMFSRLEAHVTTLNALKESHPPHQHRAEEIMLLWKGNITMNIGQQKISTHPGCMILMRPDELHNLMNSGNEPCTYYAIKWYN